MNKIIGVHSGVFHCDEVLATTLLLYTLEYGKTESNQPIIIRTRNDAILDKLDLVCDVGGTFIVE